MQDLMVDFIISLDGYGAAEGWPGYWGMEGPEYLRWLEEQAEHTALMGATTYRLMSGFAAQMPDEPSMAGLTAMPKVVFSSTLEAPLSWASTEVSTSSRRPSGDNQPPRSCASSVTGHDHRPVLRSRRARPAVSRSRSAVTTNAEPSGIHPTRSCRASRAGSVSSSTGGRQLPPPTRASSR